MKIKESKKMSNKDVGKFFDTLEIIGRGVTGTQEESEAAFSAFYSLIMNRKQVVSKLFDMLVPIDRKPLTSGLTLMGLIQNTVDIDLAQRLATLACKKIYLDNTELDTIRGEYWSKRSRNLYLLCSKKAKFKYCYKVIYRQLAKVAQMMSKTREYYAFLSECEKEALKTMGKEDAPLFDWFD